MWWEFMLRTWLMNYISLIHIALIKPLLVNLWMQGFHILEDFKIEIFKLWTVLLWNLKIQNRWRSGYEDQYPGNIFGASQFQKLSS